MAADDWKHRTAAGPRPGRPTTKAKGKGVSRLAVAVFPLLVAAGVVVGLMTWVRAEPAPLLLSIPVAEYEQWPSNPWAQKDAEGLVAALPKPDNGFIPTQSQSQEGGLEREIEALEERAKKNSGQPIVVHLNALAVADGDAVSVLLSKAVPGRRDGLWVPLDNVLKAVARINGNRLLILDLRPVAEPRVGQMGNELAKALHKTLEAQDKAQQLPFLVAAFCAPGEYPYVSPELGRGVFAEFLRLGLAGWADGITGTEDKEVWAVELVTFARAWVVYWLKMHKVPVVAPVLYGTGKDFVLHHPKARPDWPEAKAPVAPPEDLTKAWQAVDDWRAAGAVHKYPRTFRQLQELVARVDRAAAGDGRWEPLALNLRDRMKPLADQRAALEPKPYPLATVGRLEWLAKARAREPAPAKAADPKAADPKAADSKETKGPDFATEIRKLQDALKIANGAATRPVDKKEADAAKAALDTALKNYVAAPPDTPPYDRTVYALFRDLMTSDGTERTRENLDLYLKVLRDLPNPPGHLELAYLALAADDSPSERRQWPVALGRFLLSAAVAGEEAVVVSGRGLRRMTEKRGDETPLGEAEKKFTDALPGLFVADLGKWNQAQTAFRELETTYRDLGALGAAHAAAVWEWQEDVALLGAVGDFAPTIRSAGDDSFEKKWKNLRDTVEKLRKAIDNRDAVDGLVIDTGAARQARWDLEKVLEPLPGADPVEGRARLRLPLWRLEDRQKWTADADAAALALATAALADKTVKPDGDVRKPVADDGAFDQAAARRAVRAKALLSLVEPNSSPDGMTAWRTALVDRLVARFKEAGSKPALDRATEREKFAWLIHPADLPATPETGNSPADPAAELRIETDRAAASWLLEHRYGGVAREMEKVPGKPPAAARLAEALTTAARPLGRWLR